MSSTEKTKIRLQDFHSAIERLALAQAEIGIAALRLLHATDQPPNAAEAEELSKRVDAAVVQTLASEFLDAPYEY